jgi:hypothetical protein
VVLVTTTIMAVRVGHGGGIRVYDWLRDLVWLD